MSEWTPEILRKRIASEIEKEDAEKFEGIDYWMQQDISGWDAYLALEKVLLRWYVLTGNEYAEWLGTSLRGDSALMDDFSRALKSAMRERYKLEESKKD